MIIGVAEFGITQRNEHTGRMTGRVGHYLIPGEAVEKVQKSEKGNMSDVYRVHGLDDERKVAFITQCLAALNIVLDKEERSKFDESITMIGGALVALMLERQSIQEDFNQHFGPSCLDPMTGRRQWMLLTLHQEALNLMLDFKKVLDLCVSQRTAEPLVGSMNRELVLAVSNLVAEYALDNSVVCDAARLAVPLTIDACMGTLCTEMEAKLRQTGRLVCSGNVAQKVLAAANENRTDAAVVGAFVAGDQDADGSAEAETD